MEHQEHSTLDIGNWLRYWTVFGMLTILENLIPRETMDGLSHSFFYWLTRVRNCLW